MVVVFSISYQKLIKQKAPTCKHAGARFYVAKSCLERVGLANLGAVSKALAVAIGIAKAGQ